MLRYGQAFEELAWAIIFIILPFSCVYYPLDSLPNIVQEATLKFAISTTKSKKDASRFLGLTYLEFLNICKKYQISKFFDTDKKENEHV